MRARTAPALATRRAVLVALFASALAASGALGQRELRREVQARVPVFFLPRAACVALERLALRAHRRDCALHAAHPGAIAESGIVVCTIFEEIVTPLASPLVSSADHVRARAAHRGLAFHADSGPLVARRSIAHLDNLTRVEPPSVWRSSQNKTNKIVNGVETLWPTGTVPGQSTGTMHDLCIKALLFLPVTPGEPQGNHRLGALPIVVLSSA